MYLESAPATRGATAGRNSLQMSQQGLHECLLRVALEQPDHRRRVAEAIGNEPSICNGIREIGRAGERLRECLLMQTERRPGQIWPVLHECEHADTVEVLAARKGRAEQVHE